MNLLSWINQKIQKLDWLDLGLTKISCFAFGILLVFWIPEILKINVWWVIAVWLVVAIRPIYRFFK